MRRDAQVCPSSAVTRIPSRSGDGAQAVRVGASTARSPDCSEASGRLQPSTDVSGRLCRAATKASRHQAASWVCTPWNRLSQRRMRSARGMSRPRAMASATSSRGIGIDDQRLAHLQRRAREARQHQDARVVGVLGGDVLLADEVHAVPQRGHQPDLGGAVEARERVRGRRSGSHSGSGSSPPWRRRR